MEISDIIFGKDYICYCGFTAKDHLSGISADTIFGKDMKDFWNLILLRILSHEKSKFPINFQKAGLSENAGNIVTTTCDNNYHTTTNDNDNNYNDNIIVN